MRVHFVHGSVQGGTALTSMSLWTRARGCISNGEFVLTVVGWVDVDTDVELRLPPTAAAAVGLSAGWPRPQRVLPAAVLGAAARNK